MMGLLSKKSDNLIVNNYLNTPKIKKKTAIKDISFLVLDFETTGLNHKEDFIVSMGWVVIDHLSIDLSTAKHIIIDPKDRLTEDSILVHKITDDEVKNGMGIKEAMQHLITQMQNRVLIVHFEQIEKNFINHVCKKLYNLTIPLQIVDTLKIQIKKNRNSGSTNAEGLRLSNLREKYNLPRYKAHNATLDAIATAEVFLAQTSWMGDLDKLKLKDLL